jgi:hypothetical protein
MAFSDGAYAEVPAGEAAYPRGAQREEDANLSDRGVDKA